jgi:hypothetical protein
MPVKPTSLPRWATDGTNNDEPSSGQKDTGWTPNQIGVSDYDNWFKNLVYLWCVFLDTIFTTNAGKTDLTLDGKLTVAGDIQSTSGVLRYATSIQIPVSDMVDHNNTHTKLAGASGAFNRIKFAASTNKITAPISLPGGARITSYTVYLDKGTNGSSTLSSRLYMTKAFSLTIGTETALGSGSTNSINAPGATVLQETGLAIDVAAGFEYYLKITPSGNVTSPGDDTLYLVEVAYQNAPIL